MGGVLVVMIKLRRENKSSDPFRVITAKPCLPDGKFHLIKVGSLSDPSAVRPHVAPPNLLTDRRLVGCNSELLWKVHLAFDGGSVGSHRQLRGYEDLLSGTKRNLRLSQAFMFSKRASPGMNGPPCFASDRVVCQSRLAVTGSREGAQSPESLIMSCCLPRS